MLHLVMELVFSAMLLAHFLSAEIMPPPDVRTLPTPVPVAVPPMPTPESTPVPAFGNGVHAVSAAGVAPGTYRSSDQPGACYWARRSGFGGTGDIIASASIQDYNAVVTILRSDVGFETRGCAPWLKVRLPDVGSHYTTYSNRVGDGRHIVGDDIAPGTYRTTNQQGSCRWARLSDFTGIDNVIAHGTVTSADTNVTIAVTDVGFESDGCGEWQSLGFNNCAEMRAVFPYPDGVGRGHPAYAERLDRDGDGRACEVDDN
ncbi:MAG: excalibur calcium-binding domain-containing protein [Chloroflexi bacterium]|nr:excalibur calcium-binding domain-containing protein [Chloroflexota bacterium]